MIVKHVSQYYFGSMVYILNNNKAPGRDEKSAELLKTGGDVVVNQNNLKEIPNDWKEAMVVPMHEKGEKEDSVATIKASLSSACLTKYYLR